MPVALDPLQHNSSLLSGSYNTQQVTMNVNKKLDRFKQWAGERMGGEVKTNVSDDFKALELEMTLRHEGTYP